MLQQKLLVIIGPTAVGKSKLSLDLAQRLGGEIISADSMQVYRGMDIGTAKPSLQEQSLVGHHLIDLVEPDQAFNVADYISLAEKVLAQLQEKGSIPILSGGTGLYVDALLQGFLFPDAQADPHLRAELLERGKRDPQALYGELKAVDPTSAEKIHPNDLRRIVRALEVQRRTGKPISVLKRKAAEAKRPYLPLYIGLTREREELYGRINRRVENMLAQGLVAEVARLLRIYPQQPTALQALGYKEITWYLQGSLELEAAVEILKRDTRRYAKRQLSWFRRNKKIRWQNLSQLTEKEAAGEILRLWQGE